MSRWKLIMADRKSSPNKRDTGAHGARLRHEGASTFLSHHHELQSVSFLNHSDTAIAEVYDARKR